MPLVLALPLPGGSPLLPGTRLSLRKQGGRDWPRAGSGGSSVLRGVHWLRYLKALCGCCVSVGIHNVNHHFPHPVVDLPPIGVDHHGYSPAENFTLGLMRSDPEMLPPGE